MTKESMLEKLMKIYAPYYNIRREVRLGDLFVDVDAEYHARDEQYVLVREARIWAAESNEYAFFVLTEELTSEHVKAYFEAVVEEGMRRVDPTGDHMCSHFTLIFLADRVLPEAAKALEKLKYSKSFLFTLRGWAQFRAVAVDLETDTRYVNRLGKELLRDWKRNIPA